MSNHKLFIDRRTAVTGAKSKIGLQDPVAIHTFISNYIADNPTIVTSLVIPYIEASLVAYADDTAAGVGGLTAGQLYKNTSTNIVTCKS